MTASTYRPSQAGPSADRPRPTTAIARRAALVVVGSAVLFVLVYLLASRTGTGQRFENAVWFGATSTQRAIQASNALGWIGDTSGSVAVAGIFLIGLLRRRLVLAFAGVGVVLASVGTAEFLKDVLSRPNLVPFESSPGGNSFPSGHTSVAMAVMFALVLVVPYRIRGLVAFCSAALATEIGALTIIARWHRPSDTIGADLIALGYASLAVLILAGLGHVRAAEPGSPSGETARKVFAFVPLAIGTATALTGALLFGAVTYYHRLELTPVFETFHAAFLTGCLIALAGSGLAALTFLWLLGRFELVPAAGRKVQ